MASCDSCGTTIVFGGVKDGDFRFCNKKCHSDGQVIITAQQLPESLVSKHVQLIYAGPCPKCNGTGPVDVHTSHSIWSLVFLSSWKSQPQISCRTCGVKSQILGTLSSLLFGWWGFPWGLLVTPIQISKNVIGIIKNPGQLHPTEKLHKQVRLILGAQALAQREES